MTFNFLIFTLRKIKPWPISYVMTPIILLSYIYKAKSYFLYWPLILLGLAAVSFAQYIFKGSEDRKDTVPGLKLLFE